MVREGASNNTFNACISDGCQAGIRFLLAGEDADTCGHHNSFNNCVIKNAEWAIDLNPYFYNSAPVNDNRIANCVIDHAKYLFNCERPNAENQLVNCIITHVDSLSKGDKTLNFDYQYSDFFNNGFGMLVGSGNITNDPLFVDASSGDYHLQDASPCIDSGTAQNAPLVDFEGVNRPQGAGFDMGIYEHQVTLGTNELDVNKMDIYPNPTTGKINIPGPYLHQHYDIVSPIGNIVKSGFLIDGKIDLSSLETSIYYIITEGGKIDKVRVVLKE